MLAPVKATVEGARAEAPACRVLRVRQGALLAGAEEPKVGVPDLLGGRPRAAARL